MGVGYYDKVNFFFLKEYTKYIQREGVFFYRQQKQNLGKLVSYEIMFVVKFSISRPATPLYSIQGLEIDSSSIQLPAANDRAAGNY